MNTVVETNNEELSSSELDLVAETEKFVRDNFITDKHFVVAGALTNKGQQFLSINLSGSPRGIDVCGEPGVLSQAIGLKQEIVTIVAVRCEKSHNGKTYVISPCGTCRELILRYFPKAFAIVRQDDASLTKVKISSLLPYRYKKD